jgi:hypothetical protein
MRYRGMEKIRKELPGDVLLAFRQIQGHPRSVTVFAELAGTNYTKIHRLESIRWGVDESAWQAHFDMTDLDPFIEVGWLSVGDEWYQRFLEALKWQTKVMQCGSSIYQGVEPKGGEYAPISEEHFSVVIRAVLGKLTAELAPSGTADEARLKRAEEKLYQGVRSTLEAVGLLLGEDEGHDDETRGLLEGLTEASGLPESPYLHTLRFAVRCAFVMGRERIGVIAGAERQE